MIIVKRDFAYRLWRRGLPFLATFVLLACAPGEDLPTIHVAYGDCTTVVEGPVCLVGDAQTITLAIAASAQAPIIEEHAGDGWQTLDTMPTNSDAANLVYRLDLDADATQLRVRLDNHVAWTLAIGRTETPPQLAAARELLRSAAPTQMDGVFAKVDAYLANPSARRRGTAYGIKARALYRKDELTATKAALQDAITAHLEEGRHLDAVRDTNMLAFLLSNEKAAQASIASLYSAVGSVTPAPAETLFFTHFYSGIAALEEGATRDALQRLTEAAAIARRMGWSRRELDTDQSLALHLMQTGRRADAQRLLDVWDQRGFPYANDSCQFANYQTNLGWLALLHYEAGKPLNDPLPFLLRAQAIFDSKCPLPRRVSGHINIALAQFHANKLDAAQATLATVKTLTQDPDPRLALWALDIEARIALAKGDLDSARTHLDELNELAQITLAQDAKWRASIGNAKYWIASNDPTRALEEFRAADTLLSSQLARLPVHEGRDALLASRNLARRQHMALLLDQGLFERAFDLNLRTHSEFLVSLGLDDVPERSSQRDATLVEYRTLRSQHQAQIANLWSLPLDEKNLLLQQSRDVEKTLLQLLDRASMARTERTHAPSRSTLGQGEIELAFFDHGDAWTTFLRDADGVSVFAADCGSESARQSWGCLLLPAAEALKGAERIRVLASGPLWSADLHQAQLQGQPLIEQAAVVYALGLGTSPERTERSSALIVADSRNDLPFARDELKRVDTAITLSKPWPTVALAGRDADRVRIIAELERAQLFHFAGHARLAGQRGWQSELALANDTALTVADILALPRVPNYVVLSACETAATDGQTAASIGLGQAFLVRGSKMLIAAVRPVDDATTLEMMTAFYAAWQPPNDMAQALRFAQRTLRDTHPDADWSAFRVLAP